MIGTLRKAAAIVACLASVLPSEAAARQGAAESQHPLRVTVVAWDAATKVLTYRVADRSDERSAVLSGDPKRIKKIKPGATLTVEVRTAEDGTEELVLTRAEGARATKIIWALLIVGLAIFLLVGTAPDPGGAVAK